MMSFVKLFSGLFLVICLINLNENVLIQHTSLLSIRSSTKSNKHKPTKLQCEEYAQQYLDYLILKDRFFFRVKMTDKYRSVLSSESDSNLAETAQQRFDSSFEKMVSLSKEIESMLEEVRKLFELLMKCLTVYGEFYSPEKIFQRNNSMLKYLNSVDDVMK
ncbi:uncharacterized protein cubi_02654 [Cryptosporidium ubiquitum]|uniref:Uncharacterized protein n=1 Tax=Cryptosporidium ubiquitum TaxID=857276 RepID=A0A1J4MGQ8_9CRYT|nr:uncharacterized protein cubi_02654 [Cryptosporidium ubiquitum]OII73442.1 hypothetical protein cubi_02654 [Cryptosporidium ubiquitum]